jgi:hypothetical protein
MHVRANQINPNAQLDALYAAERAAANREAARTRKKLSEFASRLAAELDSGEGSVRRLGAHEESHEQTKHQNQQNQGSRWKQKEGADSEAAHNSISDWA